MSLFSWLRNRSGSEIPADEVTPAAEAPQVSTEFDPVETVVTGLKALQAVISRREKVNEIEEIDFTFQSGNFMLQVSPVSGMMSLCYPAIGEWSVAELSQIEFLCNRMSSSTFGVYFSHRPVRHDDGSVGVGVDIWADQIVSIVPSMETVFNRLLRVIFAIQREFISRYDALDDNFKPEDPTIGLTHKVYNGLFLQGIVDKWSEDILHDDAGDADMAVAPTPATIASALDTTRGISRDTLVFGDLHVFRNGEEGRVDAADVADYELTGLLQHGTIALCSVKVAGEAWVRSLTVTVNDSPAGEGLYDVSIVLSAAPQSSMKLADDAYSGLQTIDLRLSPKGLSADGNLAEVRFMKADAIDKIKESGLDGLTPAQRAMIYLNIPSLDYMIYVGSKAFYSSDYFTAARLLDPVSRRLLRVAYQLDREQREVMLHTLFMTGVAYRMTGNNDRSFFFLEPLMRRNNLEWIRACITTLMATHDFRARAIMESVLDSISQAESQGEYEDVEDSNDELGQFKDFLNIQLAGFYADDKMYEEAETLARPLVGGRYDTAARTILDKIKEQRPEGGDVTV